MESPGGERSACQPVTFGVPLPEGLLVEGKSLCLKDDAGRTLPVQTEVLARWPRGSVKWLLVDCLLDESTGVSSSDGLRLERQAEQPANLKTIEIDRKSVV